MAIDCPDIKILYLPKKEKTISFSAEEWLTIASALEDMSKICEEEVDEQKVLDIKRKVEEWVKLLHHGWA